MKITRYIRSHVVDPFNSLIDRFKSDMKDSLGSFRLLQVLIACICIAIPLILRVCDKDKYYPNNETVVNLAPIADCRSVVKVDTTVIQYHGQDATEYIFKNCISNDTVLTAIKIYKGWLGFRSSVSEYAYGSKGYLFGLLYCMAAMLYIYNGFVHLRRKHHLSIRNGGQGINIVIGFCLIGVVLNPESKSELWHNAFSIAFFATNILAMLFSSKKNETIGFKRTRIIMAIVTLLALVGALSLHWYNLLWAEWISLTIIAIYLIMVVAKSAEKSNR